MKTILSFSFLSLLFYSALSQSPQAINYQAVARDGSGAIMTNQLISVRLSILDGSSTGPSQYVETHQLTTSQFGLFTLAIGQGSPVSGNFPSITWANNDKYLKVEMDSSGGTNYTSLGASQLLSVPYALYSEKSGTTSTTINSTADVGNGNCSVVYTSSSAYAFYRDAGSAGSWYPQSLNGTVIGAAAAINLVVVYTTSSAYAFYRDSTSAGNWYAQSLNGTPVGIVSAKHAICIYTTSTAYVFHHDINTAGNWYSQSLNGTVISAAGSGNHITVMTTSAAYSFYRDNASAGAWYTQSLNGTPQGIITTR